MTSVRDEQTKTQYAYGTSGMVSYDDERAICDKAAYAIDNGLNGVIIWELSGDLLENGETPLLDAGNAKFTDPSLDCASIALAIGGQQISANAQSIDENPKYYPSFSAGICLNDGLQDPWTEQNDLFDTERVSSFRLHFIWWSCWRSFMSRLRLNFPT